MTSDKEIIGKVKCDHETVYPPDEKRPRRFCVACVAEAIEEARKDQDQKTHQDLIEKLDNLFGDVVVNEEVESYEGLELPVHLVVLPVDVWKELKAKGTGVSNELGVNADAIASNSGGLKTPAPIIKTKKGNLKPLLQ